MFVVHLAFFWYSYSGISAGRTGHVHVLMFSRARCRCPMLHSPCTNAPMHRCTDVRSSYRQQHSSQRISIGGPTVERVVRLEGPVRSTEMHPKEQLRWRRLRHEAAVVDYCRPVRYAARPAGKLKMAIRLKFTSPSPNPHILHPCAQSTPPSLCPSYSGCSVHAEDLPVSSCFLPARNEWCFSARRPGSARNWHSFTQNEVPKCKCSRCPMQNPI